jgi:glycosyltransferase involved in cell wall biosynthesis
MAVVNIVVPALKRRTFSGGIACIFEYAKGLTARGHQVNVLPLLPSPYPQWVQGNFGRLVSAPDERTARPASSKQAVRELVAAAGLHAARLLPHEVQHGFQVRHVRRLMPRADVTLATSFETALPVHLYGVGRRCYFMQHFEPLFAVDAPDPRWHEHTAGASYRLGLDMIANSSWLQAKVREETGIEPALCPNAIDQSIFHGEVKPPDASGEVRVISYGGSHATWKGFREMAAAMRRVRAELPGAKIRWLVYGACLLPPDNEICGYEPLGFLQPAALADAYRSADILLSASWYESFPLFPLEAMACGLAVVATQTGAEEFAQHDVTAEIVVARDVASIAAGLRRLVEDPQRRARLAHAGRDAARRHSWPQALAKMEAILLGAAGGR